MQGNTLSDEPLKQIHQLSKINKKHYGRRSIIYQENEIMNFESLSNEEINSEKYILLLAEIMKKHSRNMSENKIILRHLMQMQHFINMIKDQNIDLTNMLIMISDCIRYRYEEKDKVLFKVGDKGDKFYIVLKGKVDILVCNEIKLKLTEGDYIIYLCQLRKYEEYEILHKVILINKTTFAIDFDNFDYYIKKCVEIILDILNLPCLGENEEFDCEEIDKIFNSPMNKKFTSKPIIYALLCKEAREIYEQICDLDEITLISNYIEKVSYITGGLSKKNSIRSLGSINRLSRKETLFGSINKSSSNVLNEINMNNIKNILNNQNKNPTTLTTSPEKHLNSQNYVTFPEPSPHKQQQQHQITSQKLKSTKNLESTRNQAKIASCNSETYIARIKIEPFASAPEEAQSENLLQTFSVMQYNRLLSLTNGSVFGEKALMANCLRRTATIITGEATHLGFLTKEIYNECIREVDEKIKKTKISTLLSTFLLKEIHRNTFDKKYFNFFIYNRIARGQRVIREGKSPEWVCFIKEGDFDITLKASLNELSNLIKTLILGGMNKEFSLRKHFFSEEITQKELISAIKTHSHTHLYDKFAKFFDDNLPFGEVESDTNLAKYLGEKRIFKISQITNHDIIGFEDFICNDKNAFSVECASQKGFYFTLDFHFLKSIAAGERIRKEFYEKFVNTKKEFLIDRLINMRKMYLEKYKKNKIFETQRKIESDNLALEASPLKKISNLSHGKTMPLGANFTSSVDKGCALASDDRFDNCGNAKEPLDYRLTFIKNLQELREKDEKAQMVLKATLSPKRKVFRRKNTQIDNVNCNGIDYNFYNDNNLNFNNTIAAEYNCNYNEYNDNNNDNFIAENSFEENFRNENNNNEDENYNENGYNNFGYDSQQQNNSYNDDNITMDNNYYNNANNNNFDQNAQFYNTNSNYGNYNQVKNSMYMTNFNGILNSNSCNNMLKTTFDFKEKPNLITTFNDGISNTVKGNLLYTGFPIFKVDYSQNFNLNNTSNNYIINSNQRYSNYNYLNNERSNINKNLTGISYNNINNTNSSKTLNKNSEEKNKIIKVQNSNTNSNPEKNENKIINENNNNNNNNEEAYSIKSQNEVNINNKKIINLNASENILPKIKIENHTAYANSNKHSIKKNELFTIYNSNAKKNLWNRTNNFKQKSFSNLTNLYDTTVSENLNSNYYSTKNNPNNNNNNINNFNSNNNNLASNLNFISSKNVLIGTTRYSNNFNFSSFENFNNNSKKFNKKNIKLDMHPTMSTEENEIFSNLCGYNKFELKMEEKNKENNFFNSKEETENLKKNLTLKISADISYNFNNSNSHFQKTNKINNSSKDVNKLKLGFGSSTKINSVNNNSKIKIHKRSLSKKIFLEKIKSPSPTRLWKFDFKMTSTALKYSDHKKQNKNILNYLEETKNNNLFNSHNNAFSKPINSGKNIIPNLKSIVKTTFQFPNEAQKKFDNNDNHYFEDKFDQNKEENEMKIFNSTKEMFKRANSLEFSLKSKNKISKKLLTYKYNINGNSLFPHYNPDEFLDEQQVCSLIELKIIKLSDIDKLNLIPNFNKPYFNRLMNLDSNKFNNPLLESFKPENHNDAKYPDEIMNMDPELNKQQQKRIAAAGETLVNHEREEEENFDNNFNNMYRESEVNCNEDEIETIGEMNENYKNEQLRTNKDKENQEANVEKKNEQLDDARETEEENENEQLEEEFEEEQEEEKENENNQENNLEGEYNNDYTNYNEEEEQQDENENQELCTADFENEKVAKLQSKRNNNNNKNNNQNSLNNNNIQLEKMLTETIASENYLNNLGNSSVDNYNYNFNKFNSQNKNIENYFWDQADTKVPYNWGTKYSNVNIAPKKFLNLNSNLANDIYLKSKLLSDVIIDQHKISEKKKESLISKNESKALARTQSVFSKFIQKRKGNVEKIK